MLKNRIKIAWRNMASNKLYTAIHTIGLALAITCCLFIFQFIAFHRNYDSQHPDAQRTYKIGYELHLDKTEHYGNASYALYHELKSNMTGVQNAAYSMSKQELTISVNGRLFSTKKNAAFTTASWFDMFHFQWLSGSGKQLDEPNTVVLTSSMAHRYFGDEEALGKIIYAESKHPLTVVGIVDDKPSNSSVTSDLYISLPSLKTVYPDIGPDFFTFWGYLTSSNQVYVSLESEQNRNKIEQELQKQTNQYFGEEIGKEYQFRLLPLKELHHDTRYGGTMQPSLLIVLGAIGFCILLVATINYINLSLSHFAKRSVEVGTRRVLGGTSSQLFLQFMCESLCIVGIAIVFALGLIVMLFPLANTYIFVQEPIDQIAVGPLLSLGILLWLAISLLSGIYPALLMGRINVVSALKKNIVLGNPIGRQAMVILQNVIAQTLIIGTIVIVAQVHYLKGTDIGFDRESVLLLPLPKNALDNTASLENSLKENPRIINYSFCYRAPGMHDESGGTFLFDDRKDWESWPARSTLGDTSYIHTFGIKLLAGRNIRLDDATPEYLVNKKMANMLGYQQVDQILNKPLLAGGINEKPGTIVGVVDDYNTKQLSASIEPTIIGHDADRIRHLALKLNGSNIPQVIASSRAAWERLYPDGLFNYQFLDEEIVQLYERESIQQKLIWIASGMAILISSLGLLGLISLAVLQRSKEMGIRRTFGAGTLHIVHLLSGSLIRLVCIAFLIASPIAWWAMNKWLDNFAYRIDMEWWMFALAGLAAVTIALLTVSWQAIKAALANPVDSLRDE